MYNNAHESQFGPGVLLVHVCTCYYFVPFIVIHMCARRVFK